MLCLVFIGSWITFQCFYFKMSLILPERRFLLLFYYPNRYSVKDKTKLTIVPGFYKGVPSWHFVRYSTPVEESVFFFLLNLIPNNSTLHLARFNVVVSLWVSTCLILQMTFTSQVYNIKCVIFLYLFYRYNISLKSCSM